MDPADLVEKLLEADSDAKIPGDGRSFLRSALEDAVVPLDQSLFVERLSKLDDLCRDVAERIDEVLFRPKPKESKAEDDGLLGEPAPRSLDLFPFSP